MTPEISVPVRQRTLGNGLRVLLHEDRRLPVVHVALWYHVGSANEQPWRTGFAHLFEHLMFEGSRHNNRHFIRLMERAGASLAAGGVNGTTSHDRTNYYETVPREALGLALWAESDRMAYLLDVLDQQRLDTQREVVRNERFQRMDNVPYGTAWEKMFHALFPPGHPYSWDVIGDMGHLAAADLNEVHDFFRTWYAPNNAVLVIAGDYDERRALELAGRYFGPIPPREAPGRPVFPPSSRASHRRILVEEDVPHARLYCGWSTVPFFHEDEPALDMLSDILSDGLNSRLYRRMVYEDRTASDVSAFHYSLESGGLTGAVATARPGTSLSRLREQLDEELGRMADAGPTAEELQRVKAATQVAFLGALERLATRRTLLARYATFVGDPGKLSEHWSRYRAVTRDDLRRAAREYLLAPRVELLYGEPEAEGEPPVVPATIGPAEWRAPDASPAPEHPSPPPEPDRSRAPRRGRRGRFDPPLPETRELRNGRPAVRPAASRPAQVGWNHPGGRRQAERTADVGGTRQPHRGDVEPGHETPDRQRVRGRGRPDRRRHRGAGRHRVVFRFLLLAVRTPAPRARTRGRSPPESGVPRRGAGTDRPHPARRAEGIPRRAELGVAPDRAADGLLGPASVRLAGRRGDAPARSPPPTWQTSIERASGPAGAGWSCAEIWTPTERWFSWRSSSGAWEAAGAEKSDPPGDPPPAETGVLFHPTGKETPQAVVAWRKQGPARDSEDRLALRLALHILGGGFSSRLNQNLRERMGATYGAFAGLRQLPRRSLLTASASLNMDQAGPAIRELLAEVDGLASGRRPVRLRELREAKVTLARTHVQRFETLGGMNSVITGALQRGAPLSDIRDYPDRLEAVTRDQVAEAAARHLGSDGSALVAVGDETRLTPALDGLGEVRRVDPEGAPLQG